jgi:nitrogen regulatory protein P-II 2
MKYIIAIIQPDRLELVAEQLASEDIHVMTVSEVLGRGRQKGVTEVYRSQVHPGNLLRKIKIEIGISDDRVWHAVDAIKRAAYTGSIGDGKIFILDLEDCIRIRTDEQGSSALA